MSDAHRFRARSSAEKLAGEHVAAVGEIVRHLKADDNLAADLLWRYDPAVTKRRVFTVGYEGRDLTAFVGLLREHSIERVIDVRALPLSRRRGFSKSPLTAALKQAGIEYIHVRAAGNPYRDQRNDIQKCLALYRQHLRESPEVMPELRQHLEGRVAILCVEADPRSCHRSVLAARLRAGRLAVEDL